MYGLSLLLVLSLFWEVFFWAISLFSPQKPIYSNLICNLHWTTRLSVVSATLFIWHVEVSWRSDHDLFTLEMWRAIPGKDSQLYFKIVSVSENKQKASQTKVFQIYKWVIFCRVQCWCGRHWGKAVKPSFLKLLFFRVINIDPNSSHFHILTMKREFILFKMKNSLYRGVECFKN